MDKVTSQLDWTLVQSFAAVTAEGSLSGAARKLGQSQPTIGRHIKALESALGVDLFTRAARGLIPTEAGLEILDYAREMEQAATRLRLAAEGRADDLSGTVRITASVVMSYSVLPSIIAEMRQALPDIQIELVPSDTTENLIFREVDIAIRMYRPTQLDVITRHITDTDAGIYAATSFLDRVGRPASIEQGIELDFIGFDKLDLIIRIMGEMGIHVTRDFFPIRCDDQAVYWNLVCAGCGIGAAQVFIGDAEPRVEHILPDVTLPQLPIWLAAPEALRSNKRIRAVWDHLAIAVAQRTGA
jgi:DNA-binding transcriptional LysR family regulator